VILPTAFSAQESKPKFPCMGIYECVASIGCPTVHVPNLNGTIRLSSNSKDAMCCCGMVGRFQLLIISYLL
jgi:hypothetical protein